MTDIPFDPTDTEPVDYPDRRDAAVFAALAEWQCTFSDLDPGWCLVHRSYLSDVEHPHVWEHCAKDGCPECAAYDEEGNLLDEDS